MRTTQNKQIYQEASEWVVDWRGGDMDTAARHQLDAWFRRSPEHIRAFLQLSCLWEELEDTPLDRATDLDALIANARANPNVLALENQDSGLTRAEPTSIPRSPARKPAVKNWKLSRFFPWPSAILAAMVLACLGIGLA